MNLFGYMGHQGKITSIFFWGNPLLAMCCCDLLERDRHCNAIIACIPVGLCSQAAIRFTGVCLPPLCILKFVCLRMWSEVATAWPNLSKEEWGFAKRNGLTWWLPRTRQRNWENPMSHKQARDPSLVARLWFGLYSSFVGYRGTKAQRQINSPARPSIPIGAQSQIGRSHPNGKKLAKWESIENIFLTLQLDLCVSLYIYIYTCVYVYIYIYI